VSLNKQAHRLFCVAKEKLDEKIMKPLILEFLMQNSSIDDELFEYVVDCVELGLIEKQDICKYVNRISRLPLPDKYYELIDKLAIENGLNDTILSALTNKMLFLTALASYTKSGHLDRVNFIAQANIPLVILACEKLNESQPELMCELRKHIINKNDILVSKDSLYRKLLFSPFQIVSLDELLLFKNFPTLLDGIDVEQISIDNYEYIVSFFNSRKLKANECATLFGVLFSNEEFEGITDPNIVKEMVYSFDYEAIRFSGMTMIQKETIVDAIHNDLTLDSWEEAIAFMEKTGCLVESLEKLIVIKNQKIVEYLTLINKIDMPTNFTIEWVVESDVTFALSNSITDRLVGLKEWDKYLVGKTIFTSSFSFPMEIPISGAGKDQKAIFIPNEIIIAHYKPSSPIFDYMKDNSTFIQHLVDKELFLHFEDSSLSALEPLYTVEQTFKLTEHLFSVLTDPQKKEYLLSINKIKSADDSKNIASLLVSTQNIHLLKEESLFSHIRECLWEDVPNNYRGYKSSFTRKRNKSVGM